MTAKKMRFEIINNGDRYTLTFEGQITREKALRLLDLVELLGGMPIDEVKQSISEMPKIERVHWIIKKIFLVGWFTSKELQLAYEKQFNEPITLSTCSTYLSRLTDRGFLIKKGASNQLQYRIMTTISNYPFNER